MGFDDEEEPCWVFEDDWDCPARRVMLTHTAPSTRKANRSLQNGMKKTLPEV
jgi:hypothetical protein